MKSIISIALFLLCAVYTSAQSSWSVGDIPDSLKRGAHSVIRMSELTVNAPDQKTLTTHYHVVVTILDKRGDSHALWSSNTSRFSRLASFSGKVYDEHGKVVKKLKRSDVHTTQYSEHLATDNEQNYVTPPVMDYPYTVEYDWETKSSDGYMEYGYFLPIDHTHQALQNARFVLSVPAGTQMRHTAMPLPVQPQIQMAGKNEQYTWTIPAMRCFTDDDYDDHAMYFLPSVMAVPQSFRLEGSKGTLDSWESLGRWYAQLSEGRDNLLPADVQKVAELTSGCANDKEKIEALYGYLRQKTRYVSIQLGIGGWQPMTAEEVSKTGFGDCKALANYMQAMLREAGILSYQTIISTEYPDLLKGFPNMHQTDHVILTIPQQDGSNMVIECTNPQLPLGFVPPSYAGHEALQIRQDGGRLIHIDDYTPETNREQLKTDVLLKADGRAIVGFICSHYGARYASVRNLVHTGEKERRDVIAQWINLKDPVVKETMAFETAEMPTPHIDVHAMMEATYGDVTGGKLFIRCNPFRNISVPRLREDRKRHIVVGRSCSFDDSFSITLPEGYAYRGETINDSLATEFGSCTFTVSQQDGILHISTKFSIMKGRFDVSRKADFVDFYDRLSRMMKKMLIIERL